MQGWSLSFAQECGINPEAQAHWRLTASESELAFALPTAMAMLVKQLHMSGGSRLFVSCLRRGQCCPAPTMPAGAF